MNMNYSTLAHYIGVFSANLALNPVYQFWGFVYGVFSASLLTGLLVFSGSFIPYLWGKALYVVVIAGCVYVARVFYTDLKESGALSLK